MKFIALTPAEFRKFADKYPDKSFLQTPEIAKLREKNGWTSYFFGVEEKGKTIAATVAFAKPTFLGKSTYYIPGGPLLDYENTKLVSFFMKSLKNYAKSHNGYILHIEPNYEVVERDQEGHPVKNGFNRGQAVKNLTDLGFKALPTSDNPKYLFALDLKGKDEKSLFTSFKQNTRNLISRTERQGVKVRELKREELNIFKQITESTSARRHFSDKSLDYYETMYDLFAPRNEVKFLVAEVETRSQPETTVSQQSAGTSSHFDSGHESESGTANFGEDSTDRCKNDDCGPRTLRNGDSGGTSIATPLAVSMFMLYGDEVIYLFSGSDEKYMKEYNAQYAIQWHMIKYALSHGFKTYNFYGIQGLPDPKSPGYGIYKFKKGFTTPEDGRVIELLGAYELPLNLPFYCLHQLLHKLKHH